MNWEPGVWHELNGEDAEVPPKGTVCVVDFGDEFDMRTISNRIFEDLDVPARQYHVAISDGIHGFTMTAVNYECEATVDDLISFEGYQVDRVLILPP